MQPYITSSAVALFWYVVGLLIVIYSIQFIAALLRLTLMTASAALAGTPGAAAWTIKAGTPLANRVCLYIAGLFRRSPKRPAQSDEPHEQPQADEAPEAEEPAPAMQESEYDKALETLGFERGASITRDELKHRQRVLMSTVHPDTGFPTAFFAQQVNAAVRLVKKAHGWR